MDLARLTDWLKKGGDKSHAIKFLTKLQSGDLDLGFKQRIKTKIKKYKV